MDHMYYNTRSVSSMLGTWLKCCYWPGPINQSGQVKQVLGVHHNQSTPGHLRHTVPVCVYTVTSGINPLHDGVTETDCKLH